MYISAKLAQKAKLRAVVNDLASDEAKCQRSVERLLPTLVRGSGSLEVAQI